MSKKTFFAALAAAAVLTGGTVSPAAADAISRALTSTSGELCRKRVEECFPLQAREDGLVAAPNSVTSGDSAGRALPGERT